MYYLDREHDGGRYFLFKKPLGRRIFLEDDDLNGGVIMYLRFEEKSWCNNDCKRCRAWKSFLEKKGLLIENKDLKECE